MEMDGNLKEWLLLNFLIHFDCVSFHNENRHILYQYLRSVATTLFSKGSKFSLFCSVLRNMYFFKRDLITVQNVRTSEASHFSISFSRTQGELR